MAFLVSDHAASLISSIVRRGGANALRHNNSFGRSASQLAFHSRRLKAWFIECALGQFERWALRQFKTGEMSIMKRRERLLLKLNDYVKGAAQQLIQPDAPIASFS